MENILKTYKIAVLVELSTRSTVYEASIDERTEIGWGRVLTHYRFERYKTTILNWGHV